MVGQTAWYGIELDTILLIRTLDFVTISTLGNTWRSPYYMNGRSLFVGNVYDDIWANPICGNDILYNTKVSCQLSGKYIFAGGTFDTDVESEFYTDPTMIVFTELGAHSTVDIAEETLVEFSGEGNDDPWLLVSN
jgi:hypothetical protein